MKCTDCDVNMEEFIYFDIPALYECPMCDSLYMPKKARKIVKDLLLEKGYKEHTEEFDSELISIMGQIKSARDINTEIPDSDPLFVDPYESNNKETGFTTYGDDNEDMHG